MIDKCNMYVIMCLFLVRCTGRTPGSEEILKRFVMEMGKAKA